MSPIKQIGDSHDIAARWFFRLSEANFSERDRRAFEEWLAEDERNRKSFSDVSQTWSSMDGVIADHHQELQAMVMRDTRDAMRQRRQGLRRRGMIAASIAVFALTAVGGGAWLSRQPATITTELGERRVVPLADGSTISLDANTSVRARLGENERKLWLDSGRARFNVAHDPLRPFSVTVGDQVVVATGTSFSVEKLANEVRVLLYEGSVSVQSNEDSSGSTRPFEAESRNIAVGQELVLEKRGGLAKASTVKPDLAYSSSWESGLLSFDSTPLKTAAERMNRYSGSTIIASPAVADLKIGGVFKAGDTQGFVEGATSVLPVVAHRETNRIVLKRK